MIDQDTKKPNGVKEKFIIKGNKPLRGEVIIRGSKNNASKLMIASLLTDEPCQINNIPLSNEIEITRELCERIGSEVQLLPEHICKIQTPEIKNSLVSELSRKNRIPILALGPLLHRTGFAEVPVVGGDYLGHRPINLHMEALNKMGVRVEYREHSYFAECSGVIGAEIEFPFPSVGATETVLLTATLGKGKTVLRNAAVEPEILNLIAMLVSMGAQINVDPENRVIEIEGVSKLHGVTVNVMPDRNEVVSFVCATLFTGGEVFIPGIKTNYLEAFLQKITEVGGIYMKEPNGIRFSGSRPFKPTTIETAPHPAFMTDWQQPFVVLLTQAKGESIIHETVYEDRFGFVKDLIRMGAHIEVVDECLGTPCRFEGKTYNHSARIYGATPLEGTEITMTDIRAGMAHLIAALGAEGESIVSGIEHIDRGYEKIDERLRLLGADIERV